MNREKLRGIGVALVTPFKDGEVDYPALKKIILQSINGGVDFLVGLGTTGEAPTLSLDEKYKILDFIVKVNDGKLPIVAGFGGNNTRQIIADIKGYHFDGIDAILSSSPAYNKPTQEGIFQHYMLLAEQSPKPIIIYNVPSRTSTNITAETILKLAISSRQFIGVKEAGTNFSQITEIIKYSPPNFLVLSGDDPTALPFLSIGGDGLISVIANIMPQQFSNMIHLGLQGKFDKAAEIHLRLHDIHAWLYKDGNPAGVKAALSMMEMCENELRLPLVPVSENVSLKIKTALTDVNAILPDDLLC